MRIRSWLIFGSIGVGVGGVLLWAPARVPLSVTFTQSTEELAAYDFVEVSARVASPRASNPFIDATIRGTFEASDGRKWILDGFCDALDGSIYRVRFMPSSPGDYRYSVEYRQGWYAKTKTGTLRVTNGHRRGPIRIDPRYRWHFIWEGTGEHYLFNGTTAYWLMGWKDDRTIEASIDRLHLLKVNRIRVTIAGRTNRFYGERVMPSEKWTPYVTPWPAGGTTRLLHYIGRMGQKLGGFFDRGTFDELSNLGRSDDIYHPGFDYSRFDVTYWQKFDRALRFARDRDVIFSLVLDMNDNRVHPAAGSADERRFIRYASARFGAFSNITWDLGDDLDQYRDERWTHVTGALIKKWDPYQHLATSHPVDNRHQDRTSGWFDFTSFQEWSRNQHEFMLAERQQQERLGRIIPQTNEEYGYEDHYPLFTKGMGSDSAEVLRRTAWDIMMAGGYQTVGESTRRGTNIWPDTGGGWMNGRGDDTMTMFKGYAHMVDFFMSFAWWQTEPHDELVAPGKYCLATPGQVYAVYLPHGGQVNIKLVPGRYNGKLWNAMTGEVLELPIFTVKGSPWRSPATAIDSDWALVLNKRR